MRQLSKFLSLIAVSLFAGSLLATAAFAVDAKVVRLTGSATAMLPGGGTINLTEGATVPVGATITVNGGDSQVFLETFPGAIATIKANSTVVVSKVAVIEAGGKVTDQTSELDLKNGSIVSTIDPTKKDITHYSVRTAKGVAAARGTVYSVSFDIASGGGSVATLSGTITLNLGGGQSVTIPVGNALINGQTATQILATAAHNDPTLAADVAQAVKIVSDTVQHNLSPNQDPTASTTMLAAVVNAASQAVPAQASTFVAQAVSAVTAQSSTTSSSSNTTSMTSANAAATITEAGVKGAVQSPNLDAGASKDAVVQQVASAAAAAVVQTKVTEAVNQAKSTGGNVTDAANAAASSASSSVSAVAAGALNAANTIQGSTTTASSLAGAVSTGASNGVTAAATATNTTTQVSTQTVSTPTVSATNVTNTQSAVNSGTAVTTTTQNTPPAPTGNGNTTPTSSPVTPIVTDLVSPSGE